MMTIMIILVNLCVTDLSFDSILVSNKPIQELFGTALSFYKLNAFTSPCQAKAKFET